VQKKALEAAESKPRAIEHKVQIANNEEQNRKAPQQRAYGALI
jgi:hypothetical protein